MTVAIGRAMRAWASLETVLMFQFEALLRVDQFRARIVWHALPNMRARRDLLQSLADTYLDDTHRKEYRKIMNRLLKLSEIRNMLAHSTPFLADGEVMFMRPGIRSFTVAEFNKEKKYTERQIFDHHKHLGELCRDLIRFEGRAKLHTSPEIHRAPANQRKT